MHLNLTHDHLLHCLAQELEKELICGCLFGALLSQSKSNPTSNRFVLCMGGGRVPFQPQDCKTPKEMPRLLWLHPFPQQGERISLPVLVWLSCLMLGQGRVVLPPSSASGSTENSVGKKCCCQLSKGTSVPSLSRRYQGSPRDISRETSVGWREQMPWAGPVLLIWARLLGEREGGRELLGSAEWGQKTHEL